MNISRRWLQRYVDLSDKTAQEILLDLTMSTAEVEGVETFAAGIDEVVVGHVLEREKHPDADKLSVCKVAVSPDEEPQQIVCGAPNVRAGLKVAVIRPGSRLPDGMKIKKSKIRGVESLGMICSESELGISESHDGILELPEHVEVGQKLTDALDLLDDVFEIDNKSINHRPDLWGHYGIARELAAIYGRPLKPLMEALPEIPASGRTLPVTIDDLEGCPRYCGLVVEGVEAVKSPDWLRWQLAAVGQRSIDLLVDLTNFVMLDIGQPMHAFDLNRLDAGGVGVRRARTGESMKTLDGEERKLDDADLLITSGDQPVALAGVMGGEGSMVQEGTTELFVESANFHAATVRRTSTRLGLRTDSSTRFEKAQDPAQAETGLLRFLGLLSELCPGARAAGPVVDPSGWKFAPRTVTLRRARLDLKLGIHVDDARVTSIFESLAFGVRRDGDDFVVDVPSFRATKDISIEDDLIEEIGRMFRYDNIPEQPLTAVVEVPPRDREVELARRATELCATELRAHEFYDYSFTADAVLEACEVAGHDYIRVTNPVAPEITRMRRHVMPSLLASVAPNLRSHEEVFAFEEGKGSHPETRDEHGLPHEVRELALVLTRREGASPYAELREAVEILLRRLGYPGTITERLAGAPAWAHPNRTAAIHRGETVVGYVGSIHPKVARNLELPSATTAVANLDLRTLLATGRDDPRYTKLSPFPPQPVDVALSVPRETKAEQLEVFLRDVGGKLVRDVKVFEVYTGEGLADDRKSVNFTVTLGSMDKTLSAKDEEKFLKRVRQRCGEVGAELRG